MVQYIIMVVGDIVYFGIFGCYFQNVLDYLYVFFWEVLFMKLLDINEIVINDECFWFDIFQVLKQFFGMIIVSI